MAASTAPIGASRDVLGDALRRDLAHPDPRSASFRARDSFARVAPAEAQDDLAREWPTHRWVVGYTPSISVVGVGTAIELLMQCLAHVAEHGGGEVTLWREGAVADDDRAARRAGLEVDRELHQMRVHLPLAGEPAVELPPDVTLRTFVRGRDDAAWVTLNNEAFAGHAEQGGWDLATFQARQREAWFDPAWFLVAERRDGAGGHGEMVGFNWLRRHPPTAKQPEMGEIYVIGVAGSERGRGLGRALALAGLDHILAAGVTTAMLYVAAENAPAIALYRALGFEVTRTDRAYVAVVAPEPE